MFRRINQTSSTQSAAGCGETKGVLLVLFCVGKHIVRKSFQKRGLKVYKKAFIRSLLRRKMATFWPILIADKYRGISFRQLQLYEVENMALYFILRPLRPKTVQTCSKSSGKKSSVNFILQCNAVQFGVFTSCAIKYPHLLFDFFTVVCRKK